MPVFYFILLLSAHCDFCLWIFKFSSVSVRAWVMLKEN